jgi:hypothetical protein
MEFTYRVMFRHYDGTEIVFARNVSADYAASVLESDKAKNDDREWWPERSPVPVWTRVTLDDVIADGG